MTDIWSALIAVGLMAPLVGAQPQIRPRPHAADALGLLVVPAFDSPDTSLRCAAANVVRSRIEHDLTSRTLWVVSRAQIEEVLRASTWPECDPITSADARQLASQLRADLYLDGSVSRTRAGVRIDARLVLARDVSLSQPLPPADARTLSDAAKQLSGSVAAALEQLPDEERCQRLGVQQRYEEGIAAGRRAILAYPPSTLARLCIANIYAREQQPPDSILVTVQPILTLDPRNHRALELSGQAYYDTGNYNAAVTAWTTLLSVDPANEDLVERVITRIVRSGHAAAALPIIDTVVKANPGDPKLLELQYRLDIETGHFHEAAPIGEGVVKEDTAFADTLYFEREARAYASDSQTIERAVEVASQGIAKFPHSATLALLYAQELVTSHQISRATDVLRRVVTTQSPALILADAWSLLASIWAQAGEADSALAAMHSAVTAGASRSDLAKLAMQRGNDYYQRGNATQNRDTLDAAIQMLAYSDSLDRSVAAEFLAGTSAFIIGSGLAQDGQRAKSCSLLREAQRYLDLAQADVPAGLDQHPDTAKPMLSTLQRLMPTVEKASKASCREALSGATGL